MEALGWFVFNVSVFCFIIVHNGRTWVFYSGLSLCFVTLNPGGRRSSFGWLSHKHVQAENAQAFQTATCLDAATTAGVCFMLCELLHT